MVDGNSVADWREVGSKAVCTPSAAVPMFRVSTLSIYQSRRAGYTAATLHVASQRDYDSPAILAIKSTPASVHPKLLCPPRVPSQNTTRPLPLSLELRASEAVSAKAGYESLTIPHPSRVNARAFAGSCRRVDKRDLYSRRACVTGIVQSFWAWAMSIGILVTVYRSTISFALVCLTRRS